MSTSSFCRPARRSQFVKGLIGEKYKVGPQIRTSNVHIAKNVITGEEGAIKLQSNRKEFRIYWALSGGVGIPSVRWFGFEYDCNVMVLDLLGPNLEDLFNFCGRQFSLKTVLLLADQIISLLEYIHGRSYIHGDVEPGNLLMGYGKCGSLVNVIGFKKAKEYRNPKTHVHIPYHEKGITATGRFASINAHLGVELSRRDDMEYLFYVLLYFLRGSLPWQDSDAAEKKLITPSSKLCYGVPEEFRIYLDYVRTLRFDDKPDYSYLRTIFRDLFVRETFQDDFVYDWIIYKYRGNNPQPAFPSGQWEKIIRQLEPRPISQEQLVAEVKGIYAGLKMVETKCIEESLALKTLDGRRRKLHENQWRAVRWLDQRLQYEHYDFFMASQHPSASQAVRKLARKYNMPARLWSYGIHSFLELLRNRLPDSLDHMTAFVRQAYQMMTVLYKTVPIFEDIWAECLGDLCRYRMVIASNIRDKELWAQVARGWYLKASYKAPRTGRLYHHLAIVAPDALQQLYYFHKALSVTERFDAAEESFLSRLEPILTGNQTRETPPVITAFIRVHATLFTNSALERINKASAEFSSLLDAHVGKSVPGHLIALSNCMALSHAKGQDTFAGFLQLFGSSIEVYCRKLPDHNTLSFLHVTLVYMVHLSREPAMMKLVGNQFPWLSLATALNTLARSYPIETNNALPTPEEFAMRGLDWPEGYLSPGYFANTTIDVEDQFREPSSMHFSYRCGVVLCLGRQLATLGYRIRYDTWKDKFSLIPPRQKHFMLEGMTLSMEMATSMCFGVCFGRESKLPSVQVGLVEKCTTVFLDKKIETEPLLRDDRMTYGTE